MVLLSYNIGQGNFNSSSVLKIVNGGSVSTHKDLDDAWKAWNRSQGKVMEGLNNRRLCELDVYHKGLYKKW